LSIVIIFVEAGMFVCRVRTGMINKSWSQRNLLNIFINVYVLLLVMTFLSILSFQINYWEHLSLLSDCIYNSILLSQWRYLWDII
jgi:Na+(H+)/acetate symporter ActP